MVKDQAVAALIDKKDRPAFNRLAAKIRKEVSFAIKRNLPYEGKTITEFWNQCFRKNNDHIAIFEVGNRKIELEDASIADDLPTTAGLNQCINLGLATSSTVWRYMEVGNGTGNASVSDTACINPGSPRCDMSLLGTREPVGMTIRFLATFGESYAMSYIRECGVYNNLTGATMLNHNTFSDNQLNKIIGQQAAIISSIVEFCPKVI